MTIYPLRNDSLFLQNQYIYGSERLGSVNNDTFVYSFTPDPDTNRYERMLGEKQYELSNHLGNVLATITDQKMPVDDGTGSVDYWDPKVVSYSDYYPFGSKMPDRYDSDESYRFGFNGKESDDEVNGEGNIYDYGARIYNPQIGKFLSVDPLMKEYPFYSPYHFASNMPIMAKDMDGKEAVIVNTVNKSITIIGNVYFVTDGKYSVKNKQELKKTIDKNIVNKVKNNPELSKIRNFDVEVNVNYVEAGSYDNAIEQAKNSQVTYDEGGENEQKIKSYKTGVVVTQTPEDSELYKEIFEGNSGRHAIYQSVDEEEDGTIDFKRISIRSAKRSELELNTAYDEKEYLKMSFLHETGHFLFTLSHPADEGNSTGITAHDKDLLKLTPRDIEISVNKEDASIREITE